MTPARRETAGPIDNPLDRRTGGSGRRQSRRSYDATCDPCHDRARHREQRAAQVVGTFSWQTQPFCNRVTLTVVHVGGIYQLNGVDDNAVAKRSP
jgi:hypothetical protein